LDTADGYAGRKPKAGWTLDKIQDGRAVKEIAWSNGILPDDEYDEFVLHLYLMSDLRPESVLYFPVIQECADGAVERWIEIPEAGKRALRTTPSQRRD
jgi:periplasmic copper chaperone A